MSEPPGAPKTLDGPRPEPTVTDPEQSPATPATRPADPALAAIQPHPGRPVAWPPGPDQRGLAAPYPPGGFDPAPEPGLDEERRYLKLLVAMIVAIVVGSFAIGIIGLLLGFQGGPG